jgi:hypothetical protein
MIRFLNASTVTWFIRALVVVIIGAVGVWLNSRIKTSYEADTLRDKLSAYTYMYKHERKKRVAAEKFARATQLELEAARAEIAERAKNAVTKIKKIVPKSSACDYSDDVVSMLNRARGYNF